jgi:hypothetical protein
MKLYLLPSLPSSVDEENFKTLTSTARVPVFQITKLYKLFNADHSAYSSIICVVDSSTLGVMARNADTLFEALPTVLRSVPGVVYPSDWLMLTSYFENVDWIDFEKLLLKSAQRTDTPSQASSSFSRDRGLDVGEIDTDVDLNSVEMEV